MKHPPTWKYYFKRLVNNKVVHTLHTRKMNRISYLLMDTDFSQLKTKVYIKVIYGRKLDNHNHKSLFTNEGTYSTRKEALLAWKGFIEYE